jgi:hypothetical protein
MIELKYLVRTRDKSLKRKPRKTKKWEVNITVHINRFNNNTSGNRKARMPA